MAVNKIGPNKYEASCRNILKREIQATFSRKYDAEQWVRERLAERDQGILYNPNAGKITLREYFDQWSTTQLWKDTTRKNMTSAVRFCGFADYPLSGITRDMVRKMVADMAKDEAYAPGTIGRRIVFLRMIFKAAIEAERITRNPCDGVKGPKIQKGRHSMQIPTPEGVTRAVTVADERMKLAVSLGAFAGLRISEVVAIQPNDLDDETNVLTICRQFHEGQLRLPKHDRIRDVSIPPPLAAMIRRASARLTPHEGHPAWIFPGRYPALPLSEKSLSTAWEQFRKRPDVDVDLVFHSLRHYFASTLIRNNVPITTVANEVGHSKASFTLDVYGHFFDDDAERARAAATLSMELCGLSLLEVAA